jgi:CheY-like chemotaxis protein
MKKRSKLLLIDDDVECMRYLVERLQQSGCEIVTKNSVASALEYLDEFAHIIDGVILDMMLPMGTDEAAALSNDPASGGKMILDHIQKRRPGIPVLVLTNLRSSGMLEDIQNTESVRVLNKFDNPPSSIIPVVSELFGVL